MHAAMTRNASIAYRSSASDLLLITELELTNSPSIGDTGTCCDQWDVAPINCSSSSRPRLLPPSLQSIAFWIVTPLPDISHTPNVSIVLCTPRIQSGIATVTYDLASSGITNVTLKEGEHADFQPLGSLVDSADPSRTVEFNGNPYNGYFMKDLWEGVDRYKGNSISFSIDASVDTILYPEDRLGAIQYLIKSTIYNLAHNGGGGAPMANIYTPFQPESYFNLTNMVYGRYLTLAAQQVYFDPSRPPTFINRAPVQAIALIPEWRLFVSPIAAHTLSLCLFFLVLLALASMILRRTHSNRARRPIFSGEETQTSLLPLFPDSIRLREISQEESGDNNASPFPISLMPIPPRNIGTIACAAAAAYGVRELREFFGSMGAVSNLVIEADKPQAELAWGSRSFGIDRSTGKITVHKEASN